MAFRTDFLERRLRRLYGAYSKYLCRYPVAILLTSLLVAIFCGSGIIFLSFTSGTEALFTPQESQARDDREIARKLFPENYTNFLPNRMIESDQRQIAVILNAKGDFNLLSPDGVGHVIDFHERVLAVNVPDDNSTEYSFSDLCAMWNGSCITNPIVDFLNILIERQTLPLPGQKTRNPFPIRVPFPYILDPSGRPVFIAQFIGKADIEDESVTSLNSLLLLYILREDGGYEDLSRRWEEEVIEDLGSVTYPSVEVNIFPSDGLDRAQRDLTSTVVPYFSVTYTVLITFAIWSCVMFRDHVQSKPWLAATGVLSASLAVISAMGLLSYCGVPFNQVATSVPFLVLGIGLDDMFIIISSWRTTDIAKPVQERAAETLMDAGVSITITTVTDFLAFLIGGLLSPLPALRVFCLYAGVAVLFDLFYQITFFGACLVIFGRREASNRHSMTCLRVRGKNDPKNSTAYNIFCAGGPIYSTEGKDNDSRKIEQILMIFFRDVYSRIFNNIFMISMIVIFFVLYLGMSIYGCTQVNENIQLQNLAEQGSPAHTFLEKQSEQFSGTGPSVSLMFVEEISYWEIDIRPVMVEIIDSFHSNKFVKPGNSTACWFVDFYNFLDRSGLSADSEDEFMGKLFNDFLPGHPQYFLDINTDGENSITSSRCILATHDTDTSKKQGEMMLTLRDLAAESTAIFDVETVVFSPAFVFYEQYVIIVPQTIQTLAIAAACMLLVAVILIPSPLAAFIVAASVLSIITGVVGFMTFWGVSLDSISLVNLVLCIGFSVDFTAHIAYCFVSKDTEENSPPIERLSSSLYSMGYPIIQSAMSTILGVAILLLVPSYIFQTFAKIIILVMIFGLLHGLVFLPIGLITYARITCKSSTTPDRNIPKVDTETGQLEQHQYQIDEVNHIA